MYLDKDGEEVRIHPHARKHGMDDAEIMHVWDNEISGIASDSTASRKYTLVGLDRKNREAEIVAIRQHYGWYVIHANRPASKSALRKVGLL